MSLHYRFLLLAVLLALLASSVRAQNITVAPGGQATIQNGAQMTLLGDFTVEGAFTGGSATTLHFEGTGNQTLTAPAALPLANVTVDKPSGDLVLGATLFVSGLLNVISGDVNLNGSDVDLGTMGMLQETTGNTVKGTSGIISARRMLNAPNRVNVAGLGAEVTSDAELGTTVVRRGHAIQTGGGNESIARYFDITPANNTGLDATLNFFYDESELGIHLEEQLTAFRSTDGGETWTDEGGTASPPNNAVHLTGIDAFSRWTLASRDIPLPVELISFEAVVDGDGVLLQWKTASETNNAGFEVHAKVAPAALEDGNEDWQVLGFVEGGGTTSELLVYDYRVEALAPGPYRFRLKQIDYDGTFEYSPEVEVVVELPDAYRLLAPYPNPFHQKTQFSLMVRQPQPVRVEVYDGLGRRVRVLYDGPMGAQSAQTLVFDASSLPSGLYLIRATGKTFTTVQHVMLVK